jgi:Zn-dependent peptidase ImmA (M78 family)
MSDKLFNEFLQSLIDPINEVDINIEGLTLKVLFDKRMQELNLCQYQVEKLLNIERKSLNGILERTAKRVDIVNILKLGNFLNLPPQKFLDIYILEMPSESIGDLEHAKKSNFIISRFDLANLHKAKFLNSKSDLNYIVNRINRFFGLINIFEYDKSNVIPVFSRTKRESSNLMRDFWVKSAYVHFIGIKNPNPYDRDALVDLIPKIRPYTMNVEKGLLTVAQALYHVGLTIIYQPYLPTVQVRGATFLVNGKPCIVLTDLNKSYPTIWFALMHELHHVLYDLETIERYAYHITGEPDLFLINEDKANEFARDYLFSSDRCKYIAPFINNDLMVKEYAKQSQVHPSFIYNFYNYDQSLQGTPNAWSKYKSFFPDVKQAISRLNTNPWEKETIEESIKIIKEIVFNFI